MSAQLTKRNHLEKQSGVALIVGLIILLLLTIIMVSAVKVTVLEEKMSGNSQNQNVAFQAAESALREAEATILLYSDLNPQVDWNGDGTQEANPFRPYKMTNGYFQNTSDPICWEGLCGVTTPLQSDLFKAVKASKPAADFHTAVGSKTASTGIAGIAAEPEYIIEYDSDLPDLTRPNQRYVFFRITARAWGQNNSVVQLQSTYKMHAKQFSH